MDTIVTFINSLDDAVRFASPFVHFIAAILRIFYGVIVWEDWSITQ